MQMARTGCHSTASLSPRHTICRYTSMPSLTNEHVTLSAEKRAYAEELATWDRNENLANYMLSMKLPDVIYIKLMNALLVAEAWAGLIREMVKKLL